MHAKIKRPVLTGFAVAALALGTPGLARADKISHPIAVFSGLDKITGRIIAFDVATDETVQFGTLQITPRVCYTRPQTESPLTMGFVEVDEIQADKQFKRIFSGWMFAASPGLHGVEHPVYDVWVTDCKGGSEVIAGPAGEKVSPENPPPPPDNATPAPGGDQNAAAPPPKRRKITPKRPPPPQNDLGPIGAAPPPDPRQRPPQRDDNPLIKGLRSIFGN